MNKKIIRIIKKIPLWSSDIKIETLEGGITNQNFLIIDNKSKYVARVGHDIPEHLVSRNNELTASMAASKCKLSPEVIYHQEGLLILKFIEGKTFDELDIKKKLHKIIPLIKKIHLEIPKHLYGQSIIFWVFHVIRNYAKYLRDNNSNYKNILNQFLKNSAKLELLSSPFQIVFSHNDLLPANFLEDNKRIWIIDWEYAGYNTPLFDLGGLASNNNFNFKEEVFLLENYFEAKINDQLLLQYQAMKCASLLRETMWSMVSEMTSKINFDYAKYTNENIIKFNKAFSAIKN